MFVTLTCAFRYGREDLDVLGLSFRKDLFIATYQAFPPMPNPPRPPTRLQDRLLRKLGQHAHPFFFTVRMPPPPPTWTGQRIWEWGIEGTDPQDTGRDPSPTPVGVTL